MPDEKRSREECFIEGKIEDIQRAMVHVFVDPDRQRPWAIEEMVREYSTVGDQCDVEDALAYLQSAGLVRTIDGSYIATRAAVHVYDLGLLSI